MNARGAYHPYRSAGWRGWICETWRGRFDGADPLQLLTAQPHEVVRDRPAARTLRVHTGDLLYLKHIRSIKDRQPDRLGWAASLKWRLGPSRAVRTLRVSRSLAEHGFRTPPVLLAARRRVGGAVEDLLVTEAVPGEPFNLALLHAAPNQRAELLALAGRRTAELHRRRFIHGDLLPANLLLTPDHADLVLLDNDRTRRWPIAPPSERLRNIIQMTHRLPARFPWRAIRRFTDSYFDTYAPAGPRRQRLLALRRTRRRFEKLRTIHPEFHRRFQ